METVQRLVASTLRVLRSAVTIPLRFVAWVYRRRPFEPESSLRRTIDGQGAARSPVYRIGIQEASLSEIQQRRALDDETVR